VKAAPERLGLRLVGAAPPRRAFDLGALDPRDDALRTHELPADMPPGVYRVEARDASGSTVGLSDAVRVDAR